MNGRTNSTDSRAVDIEIPLDPCTDFVAVAGNTQAFLSWTDPENKHAVIVGDTAEESDQLVSAWSHTVLIRKTGSQPTGITDGEIITTSTTKNQYQSEAYTDNGLVNDTTYYYAVFAVNMSGTVSNGTFINVVPSGGSFVADLAEGTIIKVNENNSPVEYYIAKHNYESSLNGTGRTLITRKNVNAGRTFFDYNFGGMGCPYTEADIFTDVNNWKNRFSSVLREKIGTTKFRYVPSYSNPGTTEVAEASCFILSARELGDTSYRGGDPLPTASILRKANDNQYTSNPSPHDGYKVIYFDTNGQAQEGHGGSNPACARTSCTIPDTMFVLVDGTLKEE